MSIKFNCACGKEIEALDELAGRPYKCRACGVTVTVPSSAGAVSPPPVASPPVSAAAAAASVRKCFNCRAPLPEGSALCRQCGWDAERARRRCLDCEGVLVVGYSLPSGGVLSAILGVAAMGVGFLFGFLGALAFGCGLAAVGNLIIGLTARYQCQDCKKPPAASLLTDAERGQVRGKRTLHLFSAAGLAVVSVVAAVIWVGFVVAVGGLQGPPADVEALEKKGEAAIPDLVHALQDERVRWDASAALGRLGRPAVRPLAKVLKGKDRDARRAAAMALVTIGPEADEAVSALTDALRDEFDLVREEAARALGQIGPEARSAVPALTDAWKNDSSESVRYVAGEALQKIAP